MSGGLGYLTGGGGNSGVRTVTGSGKVIAPSDPFFNPALSRVSAPGFSYQDLQQAIERAKSPIFPQTAAAGGK